MIISTYRILGDIDQVCREIPDLSLFFKEKIGTDSYGWMLGNKSNPERTQIEKKVILEFIEKKGIVCKYDIIFPVGSEKVLHVLEIFKTNKCQNLIQVSNIIATIRQKVDDNDVLIKLIELEQALGVYAPDDNNILEKINQKTIV